MRNTDTPAGPSNQVSKVEKDRKLTEFHGSFSSRAELQLLLPTELKNLDSFALNDAIMNGIEPNLAEAVELGFQATDTDVKHAFFCFT